MVVWGVVCVGFYDRPGFTVLTTPTLSNWMSQPLTDFYSFIQIKSIFLSYSIFYLVPSLRSLVRGVTGPGRVSPESI